MFPGGMNPRQMKQMMKQMGIKTEESDANAVIIVGPEKEIVIEGPDVVKMVMGGNEMFNISGGTVKVQDVKEEIEISDDDVQMVAEQAQASIEDARTALEESDGDLAEAIMKLKG